ncbi:MAG: phage capsid protein [Clostridia bacterium]|nr:phage capsid protein [Clostridia bacterium]
MRNNESHFSQVPHVDIERSRFDRSTRLLTTFNTGELIPIYVDEILPGDTVTMDVASLVRMSTPIFPVMDNAYMDTYFFFVPNRLVWEHWKEFNGENNSSYWAQPTEYNVPQITAPASGWNKGSLADYMGLPTDTENISVSHLPFRAYVAIWNEFFRDQNYMSPADFVKSDANVTGRRRDYSAGARLQIPYTSALYGGGVLPVSKTHDYFTSVLPAPQKAPATDVPLFSANLPVTASEDRHELPSAPIHFKYNGTLSSAQNLAFSPGGTLVSGGNATINSSINGFYPDNLYVQLGDVEAGTINQLRQAFQIQRLLEKDARGGTRYYELLKAHFGVTSPDSRLQRPEYLGGKRIPINVDQVLQTSQTTDTSPQGNTAAFSLTTDVSSAFTKSFVEHGFLIGVACVRTDHTYQQGIERFWSRTRRFDYYWPSLAHIGEQAVLKKEVVATGTQYDDEAFGYQEAWADYRYKPSRVCGAFRSNYAQSLDSWHYADYFELPSTGTASFVGDAEFMRETYVNVDRTLAVSSDVEDQFLGNFYFKAIWTRPMPLYSVPGLIDHF